MFTILLAQMKPSWSLSFNAVSDRVMIYKSDEIASNKRVSLTRGGMLLIALLSGGDYSVCGHSCIGARDLLTMTFLRLACRDSGQKLVSVSLTQALAIRCSQLLFNSHDKTSKPSFEPGVRTYVQNCARTKVASCHASFLCWPEVSRKDSLSSTICTTM
jgi:hypothetical protein